MAPRLSVSWVLLLLLSVAFSLASTSVSSASAEDWRNVRRLHPGERILVLTSAGTFSVVFVSADDNALLGVDLSAVPNEDARKSVPAVVRELASGLRDHSELLIHGITVPVQRFSRESIIRITVNSNRGSTTATVAAAAASLVLLSYAATTDRVGAGMTLVMPIGGMAVTAFLVNRATRREHSETLYSGGRNGDAAVSRDSSDRPITEAEWRQLRTALPTSFQPR